MIATASTTVATSLAQLFTRPHRTAMPKTPADYGMPFEEVTFKSLDGLALRAWYIPRPGNKLAVMNHPLYCSRYGFVPEGDVAELVPVHVEFLRTARQLFDAGYSVLTYDLRNHGQSEASPGGFASIGHHEWQDAAGAMRYIGQQPVLAGKTVALVSHCMGANAAIHAMTRMPELFGQVRAMVAVQPIHMRYMAEKIIALYGGQTTADEVDSAIRALAGFSLDDMSPYAHLARLQVPVLYAQVREDVLTSPADLQYIYDHTPGEKKLLWIEGQLNRFDGYNYFGHHPEAMLSWLAEFID